jgi:hypothetical protein
MNLVRNVLACLLVVGAATAALAQGQGIPLPVGETVIAANVQTGAKFSAIVRSEDLAAVFYVDPEDKYVELTPMTAVIGGQCAAEWELSCHQSPSGPQRICFCMQRVNGERVINTLTGEVVW